jgi:hypothetical protein
MDLLPALVSLPDLQLYHAIMHSGNFIFDFFRQTADGRE